MRVEFYRPDDSQKVVAVARWDGREAVIDGADDESTGAAVARIFKPTPVVVDDPSLRTLGVHGESMLQPGSLKWFREAAWTRAPKSGLAVRFVPEVGPERGYDPAAQYRDFDEVIELLEKPEGQT
ncbi:MAG: hypothetical protein WD757_04570 [Actinomycetota bacterium]